MTPIQLSNVTSIINDVTRIARERDNLAEVEILDILVSKLSDFFGSVYPFFDENRFKDACFRKVP